MHEGKQVNVTLNIDGSIPGDGLTGCSNANNGEVDIKINPSVLKEGEHYLAGTIAQELTHQVGNSYGDYSCYVDSGKLTRVKGYLRKYIGKIGSETEID